MILNLEYPEFSRSMCYLEWELFAKGNKPEDLKQNFLQYFVYLAERNATGVLLNYYQTAITGSFETTVEASDNLQGQMLPVSG